MTWYRCSGGSGEVHGATIVAITNRQDCVGRSATLSFDDEVIQTKTIASDLSILFDPVMVDGTYTISTTNAEGDSVHATVTVSARDVLDAETKTVSIDMNVQLVHYTMLLDTTSGLLDECVDLTGGWNVQDNTIYNSSYTTVLPSSYYTFEKNDVGLKYVTNPPHSTSTSTAAYWECSRNTTQKVDVTDYSGIHFNCSGSFTYVTGTKEGYNSAYQILLRSENGGLRSYAHHIIRTTDTMTDISATNIIASNASTDSVNFSQLTGSYKICLGIRHGFYPQEKGTITLHNVFMTKADDWQTLMQKGNVSVASLSDFFASSVYIERLLASESAVNFMLKKCTGDFMAQAVASQNFLDALTDSPYNEQIFDNEHWSKFLGMVGASAESNKTYLYKEGNEFVGITNGWSAKGTTKGGTNVSVVPTYSLQNDKGTLTLESISSSSNSSGMYITSLPIDVTSYSKVKIKVYSANVQVYSGGSIVLLGYSNTNNNWVDGLTRIAWASAVTSTTVFDVDISSISGNKYILIGLQNAGAGTRQTSFVTFDAVWLE